MLHHFILTRFNLPLWKKDKAGRRFDSDAWLRQRMELFERYTLPSVMSQSCKDFTWVILCYEDTPVEYRGRIKGYKDLCPQIELIQVEDGYEAIYPKIFSEVVMEMLEQRDAKHGERCLTTYLDNDDALHHDYVARVQELAVKVPYDTFISFDYGLQYFTELSVATRVRYPNNHFMTLVERARMDGDKLWVMEDENFNDNIDIDDDEKLDAINSDYQSSMYSVKTCYGFGRHFLLEKQGRASVMHYGDELPMWCEVVHESNVDNDVKMTLSTRRINDENVMRRDFGVDVRVSGGHTGQYLVRVLKQMWRRAKGKVCEKSLK